MTSPFISSSFTLRPSIDDRDKPELTLHQNVVSTSRISKEEMITTCYNNLCNNFCNEGAARVVKRKRLFMDHCSISSTTNFHQHRRDFHFEDSDNNNEQYISEEEAETPTIRRRVSTDFFPPRYHQRNEEQYWMTRCFKMQNDSEQARSCIREMEEDRQQLQQRVHELEEQLLIQTSRQINPPIVDSMLKNSRNSSSSDNNDEDDIIIIKNSHMAIDEMDTDMDGEETEELPPMIVEIRESHLEISTLFYLTDGEGLFEEMEEIVDDETVDQVNETEEGGREEEDRNDNNINQRRE